MMRTTMILERRGILEMKRLKDQTKMKMTTMVVRMKKRTRRRMKILSLPKHKRYVFVLVKCAAMHPHYFNAGCFLLFS
jgi:hypothetical protein